MRYIGLDLGRRTCGVAISDPSGIIATAVDTIRFRENDLQKCLECVIIYIREKNAQKVVLGYPFNMIGTLGPQSEYVLEFKKMLEEALDLEVILSFRNFCLSIKTSILFCGSNWNGVKGFGTKDDAETVTLTDLPFVLLGQR